MKKLQSKRGFTLAELLIVVAIIAIMVAIGIPAFSTALERSRETVDLSNIRGAYAEFMAGALGGTANIGYYKVDIKQRDTSSWVIDTNGFLTNISVKSGDKFVTPTEMPKSNLQTGVMWLCFDTTAKNEKPILTYVTSDTDLKKPATFAFTTKYPATPTSTAKGWVSSGDGWILCKSGT